MEAVFAWCKGAKFVDVQKLTGTFEGTTIRTLRRLEELVRQLANAAKSIGNHELQTKFENVDMAIKQGYDALSCPRVNALYIDAVHGAFCTDFATANSNGLMLLLLLSFSGMILITLRASWRSSE